jgi:hypothetical protein
MPWTDSDLRTNLVDALNTFNWPKAQTLCEEIINQVKSQPELIDEKFAQRLLAQLRNKRQFLLMAQLADVILWSGLNSFEVRRQYGQALIDQGMLHPAETMLRSIIQDAQGNSEEFEARGLIGRIYKQLYVNNNDPTSSANRKNLERALNEYLLVYRLNPKKNWWHGINTVALAARAIRDGFPKAGLPDYQELANELLRKIVNKETESPDSELPCWDVATKLEVFIALNRVKDAAMLAQDYVEMPTADAFEIASTLRQLEEVWELKEDVSPGNLILPILRTAYLKKSGATIKGDPKSLKAEANALDDNLKSLEAIFGPDRMQTYIWYKKGLETCESVARIERKTGRGHGTGWLVNASDFFPNGTGKLLLTNNHVVSPSPNPLAIFPDDCQINFQAVGEVLEVEEEVQWWSPYFELDATFLKLKSEPNAKALTLHKRPLQTVDPMPRLYIIGHPQGRDLELSLQDNYLLALNEIFLHYRTPTEPGSSGSPVFEPEDWRVTALHHKASGQTKRLDGDGTYEANEGISILALQAATKRPA